MDQKNNSQPFRNQKITGREALEEQSDDDIKTRKARQQRVIERRT